MSEKTMKTITDIFKRALRDGVPLEQMKKDLLDSGMEPRIIEESYQRISNQHRKIRILREPSDVNDRKGRDWYPSAYHKYWEVFKEKLQLKEWKEEAINSIDDASDKIVSFLDPPGTKEFNNRGLVLGYIQSGKTTNYTAVIAKAASEGYKLFIVLSGITNSLRKQTQGRLNEDLVALCPEDWYSMTSLSYDFTSVVERHNINALLTQIAHQKVLLVVKKNHTILRRIIRWLNSAREEVLQKCPVLIIDDEADHASINVSKDPDEKSTINRLINDLLNTLTKGAYIGYTATPFANVLIDPLKENDLYPKDFIVSLSKPEDYIGTETIFGRERLTQDEEDYKSEGLNIINLIPESDLKTLQPQRRKDIPEFAPTMAKSLIDATCYFWLACASRFKKEKELKNYTILIHTTRYIDPHLKFGELIENFKSDVLSQLKMEDQGLFDLFEQIWTQQRKKLDINFISDFNVIKDHLSFIILNTKICVQNSASEDDILNEYISNPGPFIIIGGDTLSRGLTLEGLFVSYFSRITKNYDTLLQMGRWFGYHKEYLDLIRLWMREEYFDYFNHLATIEQEMRYDIYRYEQYDITPLDLAVRIQTHPSLNITSKAKMRDAVYAKFSYSGKTIETIYFNHKDEQWLKGNKNATMSLVQSIKKSGITCDEIGSNYLFKNVDVSLVEEFFSNYNIHENSREIDTGLILNYLKEERDAHPKWNIVIASIKSNENQLNLGLDHKVNLINRSKLPPEDAEFANLKGIISKEDLLIDMIKENGKSYKLSDLGENSSEGTDRSRFEVLRFREGLLPNHGLLLIYPIYKKSIPIRSQKMRPLKAVENIIAIGAYFPKSKSDKNLKYVSANLEVEKHD